ncbi:F-box only protein 44 [Labeo rohita]|uniref:F-box only protein 44 n=1 Tax=Labeo rohita TaxID=84645 RepID=A0ABQ8MHM4_LABRO|nr:F-box only protein 44 [Labeo rohita]
MKRNFCGSTPTSECTKVSNKCPKKMDQNTRMDQSESSRVASRNFETSSDACSGQQAAIPLPMVEEIFMNLPAHQVVQVCRLVCHEWKELVDSAAHWRKRCKRKEIQPYDASRVPEDWRLFYFQSKYRRNLLKNPKADVSNYSQYKMYVELLDQEKKPISYHNPYKVILHRNDYPWCQMTYVFTYYGPGVRFIRFCHAGMGMQITNSSVEICPAAESQYKMYVELLDQEKKPISYHNPYKVILHRNDYPWCQMTYVFTYYGPGVRFIRFCHAGMGMQITNSSVEICPAAERCAPRHDCGSEYQICVELLDERKKPIRTFKPEKVLFSFRNGEPWSQKFEGWEIVANGGHQWVTQGNRRTFPVSKCFVTSCGLCLKEQLIDLKQEGYSEAFMDQQQPYIKISDWYAPLSDCGSEYQICVELLDEKKKPISTFQPEKVFFQKGKMYPWRQMTHVFMNYGPGVWFIRFTHGGKDTKFQKGQRGIQVTNSSVEICSID